MIVQFSPLRYSGAEVESTCVEYKYLEFALE